MQRVKHKIHCTCADSESFGRGGLTRQRFFRLIRGEGKEAQNATKSEPLLARQQNVIKMAFRWLADDDPTLNAVLVFGES